MDLAVWAEPNGLARVSAYRWFRAGLLLVLARAVGRLIRADEPTGGAVSRPRTVVDVAEVVDDLVRDMTEIVTLMCARVCGKRAAGNRARRELGSCRSDRGAGAA
jgi:predicted site-specific integrase-resolvase